MIDTPLLVGMTVVVRFGRKGEQLAYITRNTLSDTLVVRKWRRNSCSWSFDVRVHMSQVLRVATAQDHGWISADLSARQRACARYEASLPVRGA